MLSFLNKKPNQDTDDSGPEIQFVTTVDGVEEVAPPRPAQEFIPSWFKSMDSVVSSKKSDCPIERLAHGIGTIKKCPGIHDMMSAGYIIPAWADYIIEYDSDLGTLNWSSPSPWAQISFHSPEQLEGAKPMAEMIRPYRGVLKFESPWRIILPTGYSSLLVAPFYSDPTSPLQIVPGIVDHDSFHVANVLAMFRQYGRGKWMLKRGTPLAQVIPFRRENYRSTVRFADAVDHRRINSERVKLEGSDGRYRTWFWKKKSFR
ncbi:hypothetical protein ACHMW5_11900 [Azospirillum melinis]|uniref:hypothetical protein n=1 Tax=Azospirillum melinis TaxID=328839 RepID=UPI003756D3EA